MRGKTDTGQKDEAGGVGEAELNPADVVAWLRRHPDFLVRHAELIDGLALPPTDPRDAVVDLQRFMLGRLKDQLVRTSGAQSELAAVTRANMSTQAMVHQAVLALLSATSFEHLIHIATQDLIEPLGVDVIVLCVEGQNDPPTRNLTAGVAILPPGRIDALIQPGRDVVLRDASARAADRDSADIFGPSAGLVRSDALVRLRFGPRAPAGLLALGSREKDKFNSGQGTELLCFLARMLDYCVREWLELPQP